ncbi:MAG: hypothetical protein A2677_01715, partial [Candidatus Komeilibacteria bacterium RIFCSPHIGHO2_01_FULL_52_14]
MFKILKRPLFIIPAVLIIGGTGLWFVRSNKPVQYETVTANRRDLVQEVSVTGHVEPTESVDLAFERSGKIASVPVAVGAVVTVGQVLAGLDTSQIVAQLAQSVAALESSRAQLAQYQAAADAQSAKLAELKRGTRPEELAIAQADVTSAQSVLADAQDSLTKVQQKADVDLNNLYSGVSDVLNDAYAKSQDAVTKQTDPMFESDSSASPVLSFTTSNTQARYDAENGRASATTQLAQFLQETQASTASTAQLDAAMHSVANHLNFFLSFLTSVSNALNAATSLSSTDLATYKANINTARTNVTSALTSINTRIQTIDSQRAINDSATTAAQASISSAEHTLASAQAQLALKQAGSTSEQIAAQQAAFSQAQASVASQRAQIKQAEAGVQTIQTQLNSSFIKAPFPGLVTKQDAKIGQIVAQNAPLVSLISASAFKITANIAEADIAKIKVGNHGKVTLDAYGSDVLFQASVTAIDPAETVIDGVPTYTTTFLFDVNDERIKSGMTANIDIETDRRTGVIAVPQRAVQRDDGTGTVRLFKNGAAVPAQVTVGLKGSDGFIEIVNGISEGDAVITAESK